MNKNFTDMDITEFLNHPDWKNINVAKRGVNEFWDKVYMGQDVTIKFECFNKSEAEWFETYMKKNHPKVKFFTSWLFNDKK